jgi:transcriptional regulator with XRE-family HTH domain
VAESPETGRILKEARLAAGRSLDDMAQATRINVRYLAEIEEGSGFSLPGIYRRTFVRTYARALGVEPGALPHDTPAAPDALAATAAREDAPVIADGPPVEEVVTSRLGRNPFAEKSQLRTMAIVVSLLLTALVFSVKWFGSGPDDGADVAPAPAAGTTTDPRQERLPAFSAGGGARGPTGSGPAADSLVLQATTTESVWVHIVIDNDSTLEYTLPPRYVITLRAKDNFLIAVGNPAGLSVSLNGRKMGALGTGNRPVKNVFLSRKSLTD